MQTRNARREGWRWAFSVWTPVVIAVAIICVESTSAFSSQNTSSVCGPSSSTGLAPSGTAPGISTTTICARAATSSATDLSPSLSSAHGCILSICARRARCSHGVSSPLCSPSSRPPSSPVATSSIKPSSLAAPARLSTSCSTPPAPARSAFWSGSCAGAGGNPARNSGRLNRVSSTIASKRCRRVNPNRSYSLTACSLPSVTVSVMASKPACRRLLRSAPADPRPSPGRDTPAQCTTV